MIALTIWANSTSQNIIATDEKAKEIMNTCIDGKYNFEVFSWDSNSNGLRGNGYKVVNGRRFLPTNSMYISKFLSCLNPNRKTSLTQVKSPIKEIMDIVKKEGVDIQDLLYQIPMLDIEAYAKGCYWYAEVNTNHIEGYLKSCDSAERLRLISLIVDIEKTWEEL